MTIIKLNDETTYYVDTNEYYNARRVIDYKMKQRNDFRQIVNCDVRKDANIAKNSRYYNSDNPFDGVDLHCRTGYSYK